MTDENRIPVDTLIARAESTKRGLNATETGELAKALAREPLPEGVAAPITLMSPSSVPPVAYVLHKWAKHCLSCGTTHHYSDVFALNHLRSTWGKFVRNMVPITRPEWNVPLQVYELAPKPIPFCHECVDMTRDYIATLPEPPVPQAVTGAAANAAENTSKPADKPMAERKTPKSKNFTSTDDLLI